MHGEIIMDYVSRKISNCFTKGFDHSKVLSYIIQQNIENNSENIQIICAGGDSIAKIARYV